MTPYYPEGSQKPVIFALIDQQDNPNQRQNVVMGFPADPNNIAFKKPEEEKNSLMYGFPQFVSHNDLKTRRFVVDDTLFIKVQLDSPKAMVLALSVYTLKVANGMALQCSWKRMFSWWQYMHIF